MTVQNDPAEALHRVIYRRRKGDRPAGSFSTQLMDLDEAETITDTDREAIGQ